MVVVTLQSIEFTNADIDCSFYVCRITIWKLQCLKPPKYLFPFCWLQIVWSLWYPQFPPCIQKPSVDKPRWTLLGSLTNFGSKWSRASQASVSVGCDIISGSSLLRFPSLCHLICFAISLDRYNYWSLRVIGM
jgi:hypothetical protein